MYPLTSPIHELAEKYLEGIYIPEGKQIHFVTCVIVKHTPEINNAMLTGLHTCTGDRVPKLKQRHMNNLRGLLVNGMFRSSKWAVGYCIEDGNLYRLNGVHSATAVQEALENGTYDTLLPDYHVVFDIYLIRTKKDVHIAFNQFDPLFSARNETESYNARIASEPRLVNNPEVNNTRAAKLGDGIMTLMRLTSRPYQDDVQAKYAYISFFTTYFDQYCQYAKYEKPRRFNLTGIAAGMFATYNKDPEESAKFWALVLADSGDEPTYINRQVSRYLGSSDIVTKHHKDLTPQETQFQQITIAFDYFLNGTAPKNLARVTRIPAWVYEMELRYDLKDNA